jgi:hypothetical protein
MKRALFALALLAPAPAEAAVRALFVGVNQYQFSKVHNPQAEFSDLNGTVNDVVHIKAALRDAYRLDLDMPGSGCASRNAVSTTLTDACATGAAIWRELDARIAESAPGDTVLFYFAGHGALIRDDRVFDQASGNNTTILPTDAREPDALDLIEILDRDIGKRIDEANARGINVVTIFDSCYSEGAARGDPGEGQTRDAPPMALGKLQLKPIPALPPSGFAGRGGGYRVHLAAARENEKSREIATDGQTAGVFTTQLAATLRDMPGATFDDILVETRRKIEQLGQGPQSPRGSGALTARLGSAAADIKLIPAASVVGAVTLQAGRLSGITAGSRFALYPNSTAAVGEANPLTGATVTSVADNSAVLSLDAGAAVLPPRIVARETQHAFGTRALLIRNLAAPADRGAVSAAIKSGRVASEGEPAQLIVKPLGDDLHLWTAGGQDIANLGKANAAGFTATLTEQTGMVSRVNDLIGLRTDPGKAGLSFCISNDMTYDKNSCPPIPAGQRRRLIVGEDSRLVVGNSLGSRYLYVLGIDEKFGVTALLPEPGNDGKVTRDALVRAGELRPTSTGAYRFVTIGSDEKIDVSILEQSGTGARSGDACVSPLQRVLCAAMQGRRDADAPQVGGWTAIVTDVDVVRRGT